MSADTAEPLPCRSVLITGGAGYVGGLLARALSQQPGELERIVIADLREVPPEERLPGVEYEVADVRSADFVELFRRHGVDLVVHLAAIVTPGPDSSREAEYQVDVVGTRRVIEASVEAGVRKLIYTSSGAAYGYHADNPEWLDEEDALRGNPEFPYSDHKRLIEEMLAEARHEHPELRQLIFRVSTILGASTENQITRIFDADKITGLSGTQSPFVIVWDEDVVGAILHGIREGGVGIYNLTGDGTLTLREAAEMMGKRYREVPPWLVRAVLAVAKPLRLSRYGPEQVLFLQHRPVLANRRLKEELGFQPSKTTREAFAAFVDGRLERAEG
jgi:UDP-glucose 4-epimerase